MKQKIVLALVASISIFLIGCSNDIVDKDDKIADEATKQMTMTRVQNDVNEIMGKDYKYILEHMGTPYSITYYMDKEDALKIDDINNVSDMRLVYPKYISEHKLEGSALYIDLSKGKVTEVQTYEFDKNKFKENINSKDADIIFDIYLDQRHVNIENVMDININEYIGKTREELQQDIKAKSSSVNIYSKSKDEYIEIYLIENKDKEIKSAVAITTLEDEIKDIKVIDKNQTKEIVKSYISGL